MGNSEGKATGDDKLMAYFIIGGGLVMLIATATIVFIMRGDAKPDYTEECKRVARAFIRDVRATRHSSAYNRLSTSTLAGLSEEMFRHAVSSNEALSTHRPLTFSHSKYADGIQKIYETVEHKGKPTALSFHCKAQGAGWVINDIGFG